MKNKKVNLTAVLAAVGAGGGFEMAIQGASKHVDFINQNYLVTKSLTAGVIGSGLLYFSKGEESHAAGYALLGVAGASGASKLSSVLVTTEEPVNGVNKLARLRERMTGGRKLAQTAGGRNIVEKVRHFQNQATQALPNRSRVEDNAPGGGIDYANLAYSDVIYSM